MKKRIRLILNILLVLAMIFGTAKFVLSRIEDRRSRQEYDQALQVAAGEAEQTAPNQEPDLTGPAEQIADEIPEDPVIQELLAIDLAALQAENEDVIGWIRIPDTEINYPLLQWTDNEFYLNHTWNQKENASGAIFMECQNAPDFTDFNTIIYGHNMNSGTMFGSLHHYRWPNYWQQHPYIYILNEEGVLRYDVFAAQSASTKAIIYGLGIETDQRKEEFFRFAQDYSFFETDLKPTTEDRVLTLSTCTGSGHVYRWVVLGILNEECSVKRPA